MLAEIEVDIEGLQAAVDNADSLIGSLDKDAYTAESWDALTAVIAEAEELLGQAEPDANEVANMIYAIQKAVTELRLTEAADEPEEPEQVSKKTLEYFLNKAKECVEDEAFDGLVESVQKLGERGVPGIFKRKYAEPYGSGDPGVCRAGGADRIRVPAFQGAAGFLSRASGQARAVVRCALAVGDPGFPRALCGLCRPDCGRGGCERDHDPACGGGIRVRGSGSDPGIRGHIPYGGPGVCAHRTDGDRAPGGCCNCGVSDGRV